MKIRNGFVSNSSSSSFILIAQNTPIKNSDNYGKTWKRGTHVFNDYEEIYCESLDGEVEFCRSDIMRLSSLKEKVRYIIAMYAYYYQYDSNYFDRVLRAKDKIFNLGRQHWYNIHIEIPPLRGRLKLEWDNVKHEDIPGTEHVETYIYVSTECSYVKDIVEMVEDEDTTLLDKFLFNPHSFAVLGGDEYEETYKLQREAVEFLNEIRKTTPDFSYIRFADYEDHEPGDVYYIDKDGNEFKYDYSFHWEEECFKRECLDDLFYDEDEEDKV